MKDAGFASGASIRVPNVVVAAPTSLLICFSHLRWDFVYQRPQHLLSRAAAHHRVVFLEEPIYHEVPSPRLDCRIADGGVEVIRPLLPHGLADKSAVAAQRALLDKLLMEKRPASLVAWYYTPMGLGFSDHIEPDLCVYDCMDELSAFLFAPPQLLENERELLARCDLVFTGGHSLYKAKKDRHPEVYAFPSSIDAQHFARARGRIGIEPPDQAEIPHPRLGFFGVIDERMDLALVGEIASARPDWHLVMIGPVVKIDEANLPRNANIHWLGCKSYRELPDYLSGWDVGLMPFALNESTRFISPTKTPEFLAAGVPVVSTPIVDVVRSYGEAGLIEIATDAKTMVAKAALLMQQDHTPWLARVDAHLGGLSWDRTWAAMHALITAKLDPSPLLGEEAAVASTIANLPSTSSIARV